MCFCLICGQAQLTSRVLKVYFRMDGDELIIRAKEKNCDDILQLIPPSKLEPDLPAVLVDNHVHWLNLSTKSIEVRPFAQLWQSSPDNWYIQLTPGRHSMKKGPTMLLDIRSPSWKMISRRLGPFEMSRNLVMTVSDKPEVSVELPRYGLTFFINSNGELESRNLRDMVYDETQSIGTMIGLVNRLVLRSKLDTADEQRCVLIPEGDVSFSRHGHHVQVLVDISGSSQQRMTYQTYRVDTDMGCLTGNVSLVNKLYQAYLHALTSNPCCLDPLTKRTGTEEALFILRSAACRSFMKIDPRAARLLCNIASLTTKRDWYPPHLECMQCVHWTSLPVASQHHGLYLSCASIVESYKSLQQFRDESHDSQAVLENFPTIEGHLLHRASLRAATLYPLEFREPLQSGKHDTTYSARHLLQPGSGEVRSHRVARSIYLWSPHKSSAIDIYSELENTSRLVTGCQGRPISLRYSKDWLNPNLSSDLLSIYDQCRQSDMQRDRFQLLFSLPAMTYSSPYLDDIVHALVTFAVVHWFKDENPPTYASYILSNKCSPTAQTLRNFVSSCAVPFNKSPDRSVHEYRARVQRDSTAAVTQLTTGWPRKTPLSCDFLDASLYNLQALHSKTQMLFTSCYQNRELRLHLDRVRNKLDEISASSGKYLDYLFTPRTGDPRQNVGEVAMADLLHRAPPTMPPGEVNIGIHWTPIPTPSALGSEELRQLIDTLQQGPANPFRIKYANDLHQSEIHSMHHFNKSSSAPLTPDHLDQFEEHYVRCKERYGRCLRVLENSLGPQTKSEHAINEGGQWPRITPRTLFGSIASSSPNKIPCLWRACLISFAKSGVVYQRSRRMLLLAMKGRLDDLCKEMGNRGCDGWEAESYPDWLLIQVDRSL